MELCASDSETLCLALLRRIAGGDLSQGNVWLALELLHVLHSNWNWVIANPGLVTGALFTYLRLLPDHCRSKSQLLNVLKKNEIEFCVRVLRECFQDCISIGRDLVRLLQDVGSIPDFELIWKDLLGNPTVFRVQGFRDVSQLYLSRTPVRYLVSRVTPEMENQIRFMLTCVKWGNQRRYQAWFANKFLDAPESETLIPDLVRFICCAHHPPNEILQSDIISRWAIVGWLLKCCRSKHVEANAKLALFYDWLFFTDKIDNIMNIEPAILLMVHSIPKYIDITQSLLDFLFLLTEHYDPNRKELIWRGISASLEILIRKGVVRSLEPILSCNFIAPALRDKLTSFLSLEHSKIDHNIAGRIEKPEVETAIVNSRNPAVNGSLTPVQSSVSSMCLKGNHFQVPEVMTKDSRQMRIDAGSQTPVQNSVSSLCHNGNQFQGPETVTKDSCEMRMDDAGSQPPVQNSVSSVCHKGNHFQVPEIMIKDSCQMRIDDAESQTPVPNRESLLCHKRNHFQVPEIMTKDSCEMRIDEAAVTQQKRRRVEVLNTVCMNDLLEMLKKSDEMAVEVLEKFLISYLGIPYQIVDKTVGHDILPNVLEHSLPETRNLAFQIANAFQAAGHEMFSPLKHAPDVLEAEEVMSATAVVLCLYALSRHPKLREMLCVWYNNGLAVGPRLLCYASRLADELEQISGSKNMIDCFSSSQNLKAEMVCISDLDIVLANVMEEEGRLREKDMEVTVGKKQSIPKMSLLKWHAKKYSLSGIAREHSSRGGSQHSENMGVKQLSILVEDVFAAYKEFLMFTYSTTSVPQILNSNQSKMLLADRSDRCSAKGVLDGNRDVFTVFLEDLRICCLWNVSRLLQVFRSIFCYLSDLSTGREDVIKLLVSFLVPAELLKFEIKLGLKDFSVFGEDPGNLCSLVKHSLDWDFSEQQIFWQLLMSEVQVCVVPLVMPLLAFCAEALHPLVHVGAISGLLMFLRSQSPSIELVNAILCLPKRFAKFAATVIASWSVLNWPKLFISLTDWTKVCMISIRNTEMLMNTRISTEKVNLAAVNGVISFFDRHGSNEKTDSNNLKILNLSEIRASLSELAGNIGLREIGTTDNSVGAEI